MACDSLVFLAGGGNTAHVFDEFAPTLTSRDHVFGVTRRGFGSSGLSASENGVDRLRDDVLAALDSLRLNKPVLVCLSATGSELHRSGWRSAGIEEEISHTPHHSATSPK
jgi:non-heme chloroperoxidase